MKMHHFKLPLVSTSNLKVGNFQAETVVDNRNSHVAFVLPNKKGNLKLAVRKTEGSVKIVEDIPVPKLRLPPKSVSNSVQVHENLVCRHPLYSKGTANLIF